MIKIFVFADDQQKQTNQQYGITNDLLQHNRSPIPSRVAAASLAVGKRHRLGSRNNENISCGSLNSIEV